MPKNANFSLVKKIKKYCKLCSLLTFADNGLVPLEHSQVHRPRLGPEDKEDREEDKEDREEEVGRQEDGEAGPQRPDLPPPPF